MHTSFYNISTACTKDKRSWWIEDTSVSQTNVVVCIAESVRKYTIVLLLFFLPVIISIYMRCKGRPLFTPHLSYTGIQQSYLLQSHTPDIFLVQAGFCTHASSTCLFSYSIITPSKTGSLVSCFVLCKQKKNAKNNKDTEMH